jgi:hypothetical protein
VGASFSLAAKALPSVPPYRPPIRSWRERIGSALSRLAWAHLKAVTTIASADGCYNLCSMCVHTHIITKRRLIRDQVPMNSEGTLDNLTKNVTEAGRIAEGRDS